jgi:hypothetical protein
MSGVMTVSRAAFLRTCGTLVLGRGLEPMALLAMDVPVREPASVATTPFHAHVGTTAYAVDGDRRIALQLTGVGELRACGPYEQYAITFEGAARRALPEGVYSIRHGALEPIDVFIAPIGQPRSGRVIYEACFSRRAAGEHGV